MSTDTTLGEPEFDVVVWGASGFTGRLVVEYLAERYPHATDLRWAVGGRNPDKVEGVLSSISFAGDHPEIIVADSHDRSSLDAMVRRTRVILTTVGPYAKYGNELVAACVAAGTDYCDLSGEPQWIRAMIDRHNEAARESGARILMSCAFDSVPSDIGVFCLQKSAGTIHGAVCSEITMLVRAMKGGASGGTVASMLNLIDEARRDRSVARVLQDPYSLNPEGERHGPDQGSRDRVAFNADVDAWTGPFIMAAINTRTVRRTNALLGYPYGRDFRYREATIAGRGLPGHIRAWLSGAALRIFIIVAAIPVLRKILLGPFLPEPGSGPSRTARENGFFNLLMIGRLPNGRLMRLRIRGDRDPGYGATSKMLAETAVCLAKDGASTGGGLWTPAAALGDLLLSRLVRNAGLTFELE